MDRTASIDHGYSHGASIVTILSKSDAKFLRRILEMLASNNFELPKDFRSILK